MTGKDLTQYRRQLTALVDRLRPAVVELTVGTLSASGGQAGSDLSNAPMHLGDMGTEEYLHDLNATLLENEEYLAGEILSALRRIDDGVFGRCENCGETIPTERLQAIPYARYCVPCAEQIGGGPVVNMNAGRPVGPADTLAPEGRMGERRGPRPQRDDYADVEPEDASAGESGDVHAAGTAGGGTAVGGLAGSNEGHGDPDVADLDDAMGSGNFDLQAGDHQSRWNPRSGVAGGAVGGSPAGKRAR